MTQCIINADTLNLPVEFANKFKGRKVELIESDDVVLIKPVKSLEALKRLVGCIPSDGHAVDRFIESKQEEIALEEEQSQRRNMYFEKKNN